MINAELLNTLLPLACNWAETHESLILRNGVPLTPQLLVDATRIGLIHPERVRLHSVERIPWPEGPPLRLAGEMPGIISPLTIGLTLQYGIYIRADSWGDRRVVVHELAHTAQYERLGGFKPFLERYLDECLTIGYPAAPLEQEAKAIERQLCG